MLHLRTCVYHPKQLAHSWSGHVHLLTDDKIHILAGLCKDCHRREEGDAVSHEGKCQGCYGSIEGGR